MKLIKSVKEKLRNRVVFFIERHVKKTLENELSYLVPQLVDFHCSPKESRLSNYDLSEDPTAAANLISCLRNRLLTTGISVEDFVIDISDFERWLSESNEMSVFYQKHNNEYWITKCLQHYLIFHHLKISKKDVYIDVGSAGSPWARILNKRGIKSYRLDLNFTKGIHGIDIGADAGDTHLPNGFCSVLSLQCSFEHFMGDADIRFVGEASRILDDKGRYAIVPLYLHENHFILTSPFCNQKEIIVDDGAKIIWRDGKYNKVDFSRIYAPETFMKRIYSNIPDNMQGRVLFFSNTLELQKYYKGQKINVTFMLLVEKR